MKIKKIFINLLSLVFLSGCIETAALVGPAITIGTTGNVYQAGLSFGTNELIKKETGENAVSYVSTLMDEEKSKKEKEKQKKKLENDFIILVKNHIEKSRNYLLINK
jgi:hypothetical protein